MNHELWRLTLVGIRGKKKSSLIIFMVIFLSFGFGIVSLSVTASLNRTNREYRLDTYGSWQGAVKEGSGEDGAFLEEASWIASLGYTECYGTISAQGNSSFIGFADEAFKEVGRIQLQSGRFPEKDLEIAMEADLLSRLGYDYTLGQEITLDIMWKSDTSLEADEITIQKTFTLTGVVKEYTNIWSFSNEKTGIVLSEAVITEETGTHLLEEAKKIAREKNVNIIIPGKSYFFSLKNDEMKNQMLEEMDAYAKNVSGAGTFRRLSTNPAAYGEHQEVDYQEIYSILILTVTILAVFCIYFIYMQKQIRQMALFRSLGITKRQLVIMLFYETICLCVPAILLGAILGWIGTKGLLMMLMKSDSTKIYIEIPAGYLGLMVILWLMGIFFARTMVYVIALKEPLIGRIHMANKKARLFRKIRKRMILILSMLFCAAVIFTTLESLYPVKQIKYWGNLSSYRIHSEEPVLTVPFEKMPQMLTKEHMQEIEKIPGIDSGSMYGELGVEISFEDMWTNSLVSKVKSMEEKASVNEDVIQTRLVAIPEEYWETYFPVEETKIDLEKFREGKQVLLAFPVDLAGNVWYQHEKFQETGVRAGDTIQIAVNGNRIKSNIWEEEMLLKKDTILVGGIVNYKEGEERAEAGYLAEPYLVICSETYLENLLMDVPKEYISGFYLTGQPFGFTDADIHANQNAAYLSTDYVLAKKCAENGFNFWNNREVYAVQVQKQIQTLLLLWSSGGCTGAVLLLILADILSLEARDDRKMYGILQAIGMSNGQMKRLAARKSLLYGVAATILGWMTFAGMLLLKGRNMAGFRSQIYGIQLGGLNSEMVLLLSLFCFVTVGLLFFCIKRILWREDLMKKLREER